MLKPVNEASQSDTKPKKRFHMLLDKDKRPKHDRRFKMYRRKKELGETADTPAMDRMKKRHVDAREKMKQSQERELDRAKARNFRKSNNKLRYVYKLTPKGIEHKTRLTLRFLERKRREYDALKREIDALAREAREFDEQ